MATVSKVTTREAREEAPSPVNQAEIDAVMRRFFDHSRERGGAGAPPDAVPVAVQGMPPKQDFDVASELLDRASRTFDLLVDRCQRLERDLGDAVDRFRAQIAEQDDTIAQWKRLAFGLRAQVEASGQAAAALKARCDAVETRAAMAEQRASELEQASAVAAGRAALAEQLSAKLHDKVASAFGAGTRAHTVIEAMASTAAG